MNKIIIGLVLLGIIGMVNAEDSFYSELGDLNYVNSIGMIEYDDYWGNNTGGNIYVYFSVPYTGTYSIVINGTPIGSTVFKIYGADENGVLSDQTGAFEANTAKNITTNKPFIAVYIVNYGYYLFKNSTITLLNSSYDNVNYSENKNNTHGALCMKGKCCDIYQYIITDSKTFPVYTGANITCNSYSESIGLNLLNYCNLVDNDKIVELRSISYDTSDYSDSIDYSTYINLNDYIYNYTLIPNNDNIIELKETDRATFFFNLNDLNNFLWDENNSVTWWWNDYPLGYNTYSFYELDLIELSLLTKIKNNNILKATVFLTCDIILDIEWDIKVIGKLENITNVCGTVYYMGDDYNFHILPGAEITIKNINNSHIYSDIANAEGEYCLYDILQGDYNRFVNYYPYAIHESDYTYFTGNYIHDYVLFKNNVSWIINIYNMDYEGLDIFDLKIVDEIGYLYIHIINDTIIKCDFNCSVSSNQVIINNIFPDYYNLKIESTDYKAFNYFNEYGFYHYAIENKTDYIYLRNMSKLSKYNYTGYVIDNNTNLLLKDIKVELIQHDFTITNVTHTDENGYYEFINIPEGLITFRFIGGMAYTNYQLFYREYIDYNVNRNISLSFKGGKLVKIGGKIKDCEAGVGISNVKIVAYEKLSDKTNITAVAYTDKEGNFEMYVISRDRYYLDFSQLFYSNKTKIVDISGAYTDVSFCMMPKYISYFITFYANDTVFVDGYMNLKLISNNYDIPPFSLDYYIPIEGLTIRLPEGKYIATCGKEINKIKDTKTFISDTHKTIIFDFKRSIILNEQAVINLIVKYGWFIGLIILILFVILIIFRLYNNIKKELGGKR